MRRLKGQGQRARKQQLITWPACSKRATPPTLATARPARRRPSRSSINCSPPTTSTTPKPGTSGRSPAGGGAGGFGGVVSAVPFYKAAGAGRPAAPRGQPRFAAFLREVPASRPGLDLRRELHPLVARPPPCPPHAGPPGHSIRPLGQDLRPLRPGHRAGAGLPQGNGRSSAGGPASTRTTSRRCSPR